MESHGAAGTEGAASSAPAATFRLPFLLATGGPLSRFAFTVLSGLLLAGSLPHLDWGALAWIGLIPFLSLFPFKNKRTAFAQGFTLGVFYLGVMAYWVGVFAGHIIGPALSVVGWALVTAYQAFYIGVWALGAQYLKTRGVWAWRLGVPALWVVVEWWRQSGTLGLGWGDLAYTQHRALWILQVTKLTGIWGLAFLIVLVNIALAEMISCVSRHQKTHPHPSRQETHPQPPPQGGGGEFKHRGLHLSDGPLPPGEGVGGGSLDEGVGGGSPDEGIGGGFGALIFPSAVAALLVAALIYGAITIRTEQLKPTFVAAALQGNINQNVDQNPAYTQRVMQTFTAQSRSAAELGARLTVWPETAYPGYLQNFDSTRAQVAAEAMGEKQVMLIGGAEYDWSRRKNANSLFLMDSSGSITGSYQKRQLVPFGEFVPGRRWMPFLEALHVTTFDMKAGADTQPLLDGGPGIGKIGATICFESSYPRFLREQVARGAGLLVISTDDAWFGRTAAARQHSAIAAVRAAETDRYLIRSAATGVSQVIAPTGEVLAEAGLFQPAVVAAPVQSRATVTPYVRWGDWFVGFCVLTLLGSSFLAFGTHLLALQQVASQGYSPKGRTKRGGRRGSVGGLA